MSVISFASSKGGVGKTTSAIVLGTTLARDHRVALIDADPAARLISWAAKAPLPGRISVIASKGEKHIEDEIEKASEIHDFVIVDCEGLASHLNAIVMGMSDLVIIPMGDAQPDAEGAIETLAHLAMEAKEYQREIPVRILFAKTQAAVKSRLARSLNAQVRDKIGSFTTELHNRVAYEYLHNLGGTLYDMDEKEVTGLSKAIGNAELLAEELRSVLGWVQEIRGWNGSTEQRIVRNDA